MLEMSRKINIMGKPNEAYSWKVSLVYRWEPLLVDFGEVSAENLFKPRLKLLICFFMNLSTMVAVTPPAVAPTRVPLEPAQTPKERDHQ